MQCEENRVKSFGSGWPLSKRVKNCNPKTLAATGFYYVGGNEDKTLTACFMCKKEMEGWGPKDEPHAEHALKSANCPWLNLHLEANRLLTFQQWPPAHFAASGAAFAKAGFHYTPTLEDPDTVTCHSCNLTLVMESDDDPLVEHQKRARPCAFLRSLPPSVAAAPVAAAAAAAPEVEVATPMDQSMDAAVVPEASGAPAKKAKRGGKATATKKATAAAAKAAEAEAARLDAENVPPAVVPSGKIPTALVVAAAAAAPAPAAETAVCASSSASNGPLLSEAKSIAAMAGLEFLKFTEQTEAFKMVNEGEEKIARFLAQAATVRARFVQEIEDLERLQAAGLISLP